MAVDVLAHEEPKRDRDVSTTLTAWCRRVTEDVVHDFPNNGWRMRELAEGIHYTVVKHATALTAAEPPSAAVGVSTLELSELELSP